MEQRKLGANGPIVSAMGLGCMSMSQSYGTRDDDESIHGIHRALDLGVTFFDTAAIYGEGDNETLVGRALVARRKDIVLSIQGANLDHNITLVQRLAEMAGAKRCKPAQLALAWLLAKGSDIVPIPGDRGRRI